jgi:hypothetical protein
MHSNQPPPMACHSSNPTNAQTSSLTPDIAWIKRNFLWQWSFKNIAALAWGSQGGHDFCDAASTAFEGNQTEHYQSSSSASSSSEAVVDAS